MTTTTDRIHVLTYTADRVTRLLDEVEALHPIDVAAPWRKFTQTAVDRRARLDRIADHLREGDGARITITPREARMSCYGVTASAASGPLQMFRAWVARARAEADRLRRQEDAA